MCHHISPDLACIQQAATSQARISRCEQLNPAVNVRDTAISNSNSRTSVNARDKVLIRDLLKDRAASMRIGTTAADICIEKFSCRAGKGYIALNAADRRFPGD
jgi:hypothetical protein